MRRVLMLVLVGGPVGAMLLLAGLASGGALALAGVGGAAPGGGAPGGGAAHPTPALTGGPPGALALADIPPVMLELYLQAAPACPGLPWSILAAVGKVETDHGRDVHISSAGAAGPMQFLPSTWAQYGVDTDGDGVPEIADPADSVASAAGYLCANGGGSRVGWWNAIWNYNHDPGYVSLVLGLAARYEAAAVA